MVYALTTPINALTTPNLWAIPASGIPAAPDSSPTLMSVKSLSAQLRSALVDLKNTLHHLETSTAQSHKRLQLNSLQVQLQSLDGLLQSAIVLLQPTAGNASRIGDRRHPSDHIPDASLEEIRSLFTEIIDTLQKFEVHQ